MLKNSTESQRWSSFKTFYFCTTICCFTQEQPVELVLTPWPSIRLSISSLYLKELHSDTSKHELQQRGDDHDVANSPDGHKDTLDHMLQNPHSYILLIQSSIINKGAWMHKYTGETHSQWKLDTYRYKQHHVVLLLVWPWVPWLYWWPWVDGGLSKHGESLPLK